MFGIGNYRQKFLRLFHTEHLWQLMFFAGIKLGWNNERRRHYMLKGKAIGLRHLVAFFSSHFIRFNDVVDVINNVFVRNGSRENIIIMRKNKTHFLRVIADGAWRIALC